MVVGAGIAGVQAALDLANSGFYVHLVEKKASIGGVMAQLDKTFPTNDCSMCIMSPKLVECGRHLNIEMHTLSEVKGIDGEPGNFQVTVEQRPRFIDSAKCIACGICAQKCPKKVPDEFNQGLGEPQSRLRALSPGGTPEICHRPGHLHLLQKERQMQGLRKILSRRRRGLQPEGPGP